MTRPVAISDAEAQRMMAQQQADMERREAQDEQREAMLRAFVSTEGRERLKRIEQVKPERARAVEMYIINAVRGGKMQPPVSDAAVRDILTQIVEAGGEGSGTGPKVTVMRKKSDDDW